MKRIYLIPNIITAFGLTCGLFVIFRLNTSESHTSAYELLHSATLLIFLAAFADLMDGAIARIIKAESEFGLMFDALADAISFGVAPAVLFLKSLSLGGVSGLSFFAITGAMLYALCGILRLVRFNVNAHAVKGDALSELTYHSNFTGLPIPAGAAGAVSLNLFVHSPSFMGWIHLSDTAKTIGLTCCMILLGYLMICKWKFPSIKTLRIRVPFLYLLLFTVVLAIFILYGIFYYLPLMLLVGSLGYIVTGCTLTVIRLIAGKKSTTLVEFEPESEGEEEM